MINLCPFLIALFLQGSSGGELEINAVACRDASRSFLISAFAFDVVAVVLSLLLKSYWDNRLRWSQSIRLGISLAIAFVLSSALVAWNPMKDEMLTACIESPEFSRYVLMAHVSPIPKGIVLGGAISAVFFFFVVIILSLFSKRH